MSIAGAQPGTRPLPPDTVALAASAASPPVYLRTLGQLPSAYVSAADPQFRVVMAPAPIAAALDTLAAVDVMGRMCKGAPSLDQAPAGLPPEPVALDAERYLVLVVVPGSYTRRICEQDWNATALSIWRGLAFNDTTLARLSPPGALSLTIDGVAIPAVASVARPAFERRNNGWARVGDQLRYYYDMAVLAPRRDGRPHVIEVAVWLEGGRARVLSPAAEVARMSSDQFVVWRLATDPRHGGESSVTLTPKHPIIGGIRSALAEAAGGRLEMGAMKAVEWLGAAPRQRDGSAEGTVAKLLVAEAMVQRGDSDVAAAFVADAQRSHPCLVPPAGASPAVLRLATTLRSEPSCREYDPRAAFRRGLLLPGLGHAVQNERRAALTAGGIVAGVFVRALVLNAEGNRRYAEYQASTDYGLAPQLHSEAASVRSRARTAFLAGIGLWVGDAILAALQARTHNEMVARDRQ
jgi:hypothetical protein